MIKYLCAACGSEQEGWEYYYHLRAYDNGGESGTRQDPFHPFCQECAVAGVVVQWDGETGRVRKIRRVSDGQ